MLGLLLHGIGAGIIFSFLTGPVFFAMLKTSIESGFKAGFSLAAGVILSDAIFISFTIFSSFLVSYNERYANTIGLLGGAFLLGIGLWYMLKKINVSYQLHKDTKVQAHGYFIKGFFMSLLSPTTLMFWLAVGGLVSAQLKYNTQQKLIFFSVALATQLSVDCLKTYYAAKLREKIKPSSIQLLNRVAGGIIAIFALRLLIEALMHKF